ncbi:HD-GYP domain-containing protein [Marinisporobacter balticus]|uniref:HD-GYP domain-containing protein (C-di-GMP phosphodiesterase class II) n=1 Tax=Marinisporobacter balticus TaxID=2018667 RepID=A0A4R2KWG5_9FIRM|nr:HD-GYP domain-containing protein [Marinisporobacter balticus]TCO71035.1 HD-GYP domain-containing protein (c-di-GMP phosphodiesterase class II) [Marinisporobacter balticus]
MRLVPIDAVKEGAFLAQTIYNEKGQILLSKGVKINERLKAKVREQGFCSIYIIDEYSQGELDDIIKPQVRQKAVATIRGALNVFADIDNDHLNTFQKKKLEKESEQQLQSMQEVAKLIVDDVFTQKEIMINLVDIKSADNYTYNHSVNTGILALILGIGYGLNKNDLYDLTMGTILHDAGKMFIPKEILNEKGKLDPDKYKIIKEHTTRGFNYLKDNTNINGKIRLISLQHHEKIDGTGYPYGIQDTQIYSLAKIAAIADVYDALTSDRPYRKALPPNEAIEYIMGSGGRHFDMDLVKVFIKKVNPYPVGTMVYLSNNSIAIVEAINNLYTLRPIVKVLKQEGKIVEPFLCDLKKENNIVIAGICYEL